MSCKYCESYEDNETLEKLEQDTQCTYRDLWEVEIVRYGQDERRKTALLTLQCETQDDYCYTDFQIKYCPFCGEKLEVE